MLKWMRFKKIIWNLKNIKWINFEKNLVLLLLG